MDKAAAMKIAKQYVQEAAKKYSVKKAFLFGSFALGTAHEDSDIDIALFIENINNTTVIQLKLMQLRRDINMRIEPHAFFANTTQINNPFVFEIIKNGVLID